MGELEGCSSQHMTVLQPPSQSPCVLVQDGHSSTSSNLEQHVAAQFLLELRTRRCPAVRSPVKRNASSSDSPILSCSSMYEKRLSEHSIRTTHDSEFSMRIPSNAISAGPSGRQRRALPRGPLACNNISRSRPVYTSVRSPVSTLNWDTFSNDSPIQSCSSIPRNRLSTHGNARSACISLSSSSSRCPCH